MIEEIGTVISTPLGPSPTGLNFVVNKGKIHRGQFVEMNYSEGTLVALVTNVYKTNRYFERAESVKEFEKKGSALVEQFPTSEWEYVVAETRPLGVFTEKLTQRPTFPPSPGTKVKSATSESLKRFFKFDEKTGLHLGKVEYHDLDVKVNMTKMLQKHLAILAMSGSGKSYAVSVLFEEILNRTKEQGRIAVVVLDPHGEYSSFAEPVKDKEHIDYSNKTKIVKGQNIKIAVPKLSAEMFSLFLSSLQKSSAQKRELSRILKKLNKEMRDGLGPYDLYKLRKLISNDGEIKENVKAPLIGSLMGLEDLNLFGKMDSPSVYDIVKPGTLTVIDLSDIISIRKKQMIVTYFASKLFSERRAKKIAPCMLVLEEAHQFVPESVSREAAPSKSIIRTIAREGRKFGASLCLISQRPVQLDTTALSQCNTQIILRVTNPNDLKHISESSEGIDSKSADMITSLQVGEALMVGEAVSYPLFFKVRKRKSLESKHEIPLEKQAINFETFLEESKDETLEFL